MYDDSDPVTAAQYWVLTLEPDSCGRSASRAASSSYCRLYAEELPAPKVKEADPVCTTVPGPWGRSHSLGGGAAAL